MSRVVLLRVALAALLVAPFAVAPACDSMGETLLAQRGRDAGDGMPKGSYRDSCQCQFSGGLTLICYCANIQGRLFQTTMDVRSCPAPKDIRNCDGRLKCTEKGQEC